MNRFTVEETNLISIYSTGTRSATVEEMTAALIFMDDDIRELTGRTLRKLNAITDEDFSQLGFDSADEQDG